ERHFRVAACRSRLRSRACADRVGRYTGPLCRRDGHGISLAGMTRYIALLRAVNVGGTGKLPMTGLRAICSDAGFARVETYIASGKVIFESDTGASAVKARLEARLLAYTGKPVGVLVRTAPEMAAILKANPFPAAEPKYTYAIFLNDRPPANALDYV